MLLALVILFFCFGYGSKISPIERFPDHFIDINFYHIYYRCLAKVPNWQAYVRSCLILDVNVAKAYKAEQALLDEILIPLEKRKEFGYAKGKVLAYEIALKNILNVPECSIQDIEKNEKLILEYISYFTSSVWAILRVKLGVVKSEFNILDETADRNEIIFWDVYFTWLAIFLNFEAYWFQSLEILSLVRESGRLWACCEAQDEQKDGLAREMYRNSNHLTNLIEYQKKEPGRFWFYSNLFGKLNKSLSKLTFTIQKTISKLLDSHKGNNISVMDDLREYELLRNQLNSVKVDFTESTAKEALNISLSIKNQIRSLLGPLQKYIPDYEVEPKSIAQLFAQLVNENRFLLKILSSDEYPPDLFGFLADAFEQKLESFRELIRSLRFTSDNVFIFFYTEAIKKFPPIPKKSKYAMDFTLIRDPQDILKNIKRYGIPINSIPTHGWNSHIHGSVAQIYSIVANLAASFAFRTFSKLFALSSERENSPFADLDQVARDAKIDDFICYNYLQHMDVAAVLIDNLDNEIERLAIKEYMKMSFNWIRSKCYCFFYINKTEDIWKKLGTTFVIPVDPLQITGIYNLECTLQENSNDPVWGYLQYQFLDHFADTINTLQELWNTE